MIKIEDVAFVRFRAPDLDVIRRFLLDFGMVEVDPEHAGSKAPVLRMRGSGPAPFVHETILGDAGFDCIGLRASSVPDLEKLAESEQCPLEPIAGPGGGQFIRLTDPNGFHIEVVAGQTPVLPVQSEARVPLNDSEMKMRTEQPKRLSSGPASVVRLGHVVMTVGDVAATNAWWSERFGLLTSDEVYTPGGHLAAVFIRCDQGDKPTDHHSLNFAAVPSGAVGFHHAAFEVRDFDDLMTGSDYLKAAGHKQIWGVGRHILGSQIFDYWADPFGHFLEHWTDGDLFTATHPTDKVGLDIMTGIQWGPPMSPDFV